jgi:uncharacterized protein
MAKADSTIRVRLTPRSGRTELQRYENGVLHARVTAPPVDGAANTALISLLANLLGVPKSSVSIVSGASSREKKVAIAERTQNEVESLLRGRFAAPVAEAEA